MKCSHFCPCSRNVCTQTFLLCHIMKIFLCNFSSGTFVSTFRVYRSHNASFSSLSPLSSVISKLIHHPSIRPFIHPFTLPPPSSLHSSLHSSLQPNLLPPFIPLFITSFIPHPYLFRHPFIPTSSIIHSLIPSFIPHPSLFHHPFTPPSSITPSPHHR